MTITVPSLSEAIRLGANYIEHNETTKVYIVSVRGQVFEVHKEMPVLTKGLTIVKVLK